MKKHDKFQQMQNEVADAVRKVKVELQQYNDTHGDKEKVIERETKVSQLISTFPKVEASIAKMVELSEPVIASTGPEGQEATRAEIRQIQMDWKSTQNQAHESQKTLSDCIASWSEFTSALDNMKQWLDQFQKRVSDEQGKENKTYDDLARCKRLVEEAVYQKPVLDDLNDKCEALLELSACSWARDRTVQLQSRYTALLTETQGLLSKIEKNLSDHTEFLKAKKELEAWLATAHGSVQDCVGVGDVDWAKDKLETLKVNIYFPILTKVLFKKLLPFIIYNLFHFQLVATRITEGQHLLTVLQNSFAKAINTALPEQQDQLRTDMADLRSSWEQLNIALTTVQAKVNTLLTRWEDHAEMREKLTRWLNEIEETISNLPDTKGKFGEMKTLLERHKHLHEEVVNKRADLDDLLLDANELSTFASDSETRLQAARLLDRWEKVRVKVEEKKSLVEDEMQEYNAYHTALQETEKWLLQISFQLMSHNSLYITNKEQTLEQIKQHDALMEEIENYQTTLEDLRQKGLGQIDRYVSVNPSIRPTIESQLQNVRDSYNSLSSTAMQIKNRLAESLSKFEEYENTLESIMRNLDSYEPEIKQVVQGPLDSLTEAEENLEQTRILHQKLQGEKARLALAIEACEAAAACVSRPGSPLDAPPVQIPEREIEVRTRLEDFIDQVKLFFPCLTVFICCKLVLLTYTDFFIFIFEFCLHVCY